MPKAGVLVALGCAALWAGASAPGAERSAAPVDEIRIRNVAHATLHNRPVSVARPFAEGEIPGLAQASIDGVRLPTQCDVKNRWPDGSLKFAVVSFVVPEAKAGATITVTFSSQVPGAGSAGLSKSEMLSADYNFDGQIQLAGTVNRQISARAMLAAADACHDPGNDVDSGRYLCTYWLKGPIVTAVLLEDRTPARSFDVSTDGLPGTPLHPMFEAWFYSQDKSVQLGYTLEDDWASTNPEKSARDQGYALVLTGGDRNPVIEYRNAPFIQITRSRWHKTFWLNQQDPAPQLNVDNNWPYLAATRFFPHWDPDLRIAESLIAAKVASFERSSRVLEGCAKCYAGDAGIGNFQRGLNAGGAADWHGPLTTWDIVYLISQDPRMLRVVLGNADLAGRIPYFYREADENAGHGRHFDAESRGSTPTFGRVISVNARTQVSLQDATSQDCGRNYPEDWINFGGSGQDTQGWDLDTSHWPNLAYASYLSTGQYAYYEEQMMQSAYAIADSPGTRACVQADKGSLRQGSLGYWYIDQERGTAWMARENAIGAFIAVDGSPEQSYFRDKLFANLAVWEGCHNIRSDLPASYAAAWSYGNTVRGPNYPLCGGTALGSWTRGMGGEGGYQTNAKLNQTGPHAPTAANANFQNAYSTVILGWIDDFGFCPHTDGSCRMLALVADRYLNMALNPAASIYNLSDYVYPTLGPDGRQIESWEENQSLYATPTRAWPACGTQNPDEGYTMESAAAMSYLSRLRSLHGGYDGAAAYHAIRSTMGCINNTPGFDFASGSPKWDITPR